MTRPAGHIQGILIFEPISLSVEANDEKVLFITLFSCISANFAYFQKLAEPKLVGTWRVKYEDYGEFIYRKVEEFASYLKENPSAKMVARLCSRDKMSVALAGSGGFAFTFPEYATSIVCWLVILTITIGAGD